jgi:FkbM family methyltransferase
MKEAFVLVGPLAVGKSYVGRLMESSFGVAFLEYEKIFIDEQNKCQEGYLERAEPLAQHVIMDFLNNERKICFENTMNREYGLEILRKLHEVADVRTIKVCAPFDIALERFRKRNWATNVKWTEEEFKRTYAKCEDLDLNYDLVLENSDQSDDDIKMKLAPLMSERKWFDDHMEVQFNGQTLKFCCWSDKNLTPYDMEYKPWRAAFRKENIGYLKNYALRQGDVVIDAGAYEGTFTVYAAKAVGDTGRVIAFEPDTENFRKLRENVEFNHLNNVTMINKALWCKDKRLFFNDKHTAGASFFFNASNYKKEVDVVSVDREMTRLGVKKVDFIKIDVEGSETQVIRGCENVLKENDVNLAVSTYHIVNGEETCAAVEDILGEFGYATKTEFPQHKTTYGSRISE